MDGGRSDADGFADDILGGFLDNEPSDAIRISLKRILSALAKRFYRIGYVQGMNYIARVLIAFLSESDVWTSLDAISNFAPFVSELWLSTADILDLGGDN